jgi:hypothetical protein
MSSGGCSIVWFRRDLRVEDNPALAAGVRAGAVVGVFIWAPEEEGQYYPGRVSRWWLKNSLAHLDSSLRNLGTPLVTKRSTDSVSSLLEVVKSTGATQIFFNHLYGQFLYLSYLFVYSHLISIFIILFMLLLHDSVLDCSIYFPCFALLCFVLFCSTF